MLFAVPAVSAAGGMLIAILILVAIVLATAAWVYKDAKSSAGRGHPIVSSVGSLQLNTPMAWFLACLVLWELCFPLLLHRQSQPFLSSGADGRKRLWFSRLVQLALPGLTMLALVWPGSAAGGTSDHHQRQRATRGPAAA